MLKNVLGVLALTAALCAVGARAEEPAAKDPRAALLKLLPAGAKLDDLHPSPIPGVYEFSQGADVSYLTADGKYFIDGNIYDMRTRENLTEARRDRMRAALIDAVPESEMLIFGQKSAAHTITVFTDVDCPYCRKLHGDIDALNKLGVRVRYLFYPRTGPNTESWHKAEAVWCSPDRNAALTRAKAGAKLDVGKACTPNPVAREYELGQTVGVRGTPAIIASNGTYISGYMPPQDLLKAIEEAEKSPR